MRETSASAPGRVNLIGEHTDYHDGFVLPCAVPQRTTAMVRTRGDRRVRAWSEAMEPAPVEFDLGREHKSGGWGDYVQGLTWALAGEAMNIGGFDLHVRSDVPPGSGLASSAALEIAVLRALREAFELSLTDVALAQVGRRAEAEFVGAPVGIMDQMAASLAAGDEALFIDTRSLTFERIALPGHLELVVIDSGISHRHAAGGYTQRRSESEAAARLLGVTTLRDIAADDLPRLSALPPLLARRARHVVTENARVLRAVAALRSGDLESFGRLLTESHASLRDDYEVSVPEVDLLVALASAHPAVFGARITGGGFGGAIVIAAARGAGRDVASHVTGAYPERSKQTPTILMPQAN